MANWDFSTQFKNGQSSSWPGVALGMDFNLSGKPCSWHASTRSRRRRRRRRRAIRLHGTWPSILIKCPKWSMYLGRYFQSSGECQIVKAPKLIIGSCLPDDLTAKPSLRLALHLAGEKWGDSPQLDPIISPWCDEGVVQYIPASAQNPVRVRSSNEIGSNSIIYTCR